MHRHHPNNERMKREYLTYLEQAKRMSPSTIDQVASSIALFEQSTGYKDFRKFHRQQAIAFKERMQHAVSPVTGKELAKATTHSRLMAMKAFVHWLHGRPGFRSCITYDDAEYFNPSANDERIAKAVRERPVPSLEQISSVITQMPSGTIVQRRDQALVAAGVVFGARDNALASLALRHVDLAHRTVFQDARTVRTKNAKTFASGFFPVDPMFEAVVRTWIEELVDLGYGPDDPVFPATEVRVGADQRFEATGLSRTFWRNAGAVRRIFREAFEGAGLPYFNPHSFRKTLAIHGEKHCRTAEEWKAYSQNFGHSSPMTTFNAYGPVAHHRQVEIMAALSSRATASPEGGSLSERQVQEILSNMGQALRAR